MIKKVEGIIIKETSYKETSKIVNIFTDEYGIIGVLCKGAKRLKSPFSSSTGKLTYANFHINYKENGLSTLIDGDIKNYFFNIKNDIVKISYLSYLIELAVHTYKESENNEVYNLLIDSILKIEDNLDPRIITNILEVQYLSYLGINLNLDECVKCGSSKVVTLSMNKGGYVCANCRDNEELIDEKVLKLLRLYQYVDISKISSLDIDENNSKIISKIIDEYYDLYSGLRTKSKKFLKEIDL